MIESFADKRTAALFLGHAVKGLDRALAQRAFDKLRMLHAAADVADLRSPPGNRLEKLSGDRRGQWSIRINEQWRIAFAFADGHASDVEVVDYH